MIVRLGLVVAASLAAFTVKQFNAKGSKSGTLFMFVQFLTIFFFYHFARCKLQKMILHDSY